MLHKNLACQRHVPNVPGQLIACPLCRVDASQGHMFRSCKQPDMSKQEAARHDKAIRTVISSFHQRAGWCHYPDCRCGKDIGVHKRLWKLHSKIQHLCSQTDVCLDPMVQRGAADTSSKMTPGTMIIEMIITEQQQYLPMTTVLDPNWQFWHQ